MGKVIPLLLTILLALASIAGYLVLTEKIIAGESQIALGQRQVGEKQVELDQGEARLEAGRQKSLEGKKKYEKAKGNPFLVLADKLLRGGKGFRDARKQIAEGDKRIAEGEQKVDIGGKRLDAGKSEVSRGRERLKMAKRARDACAVGVALFGSVSIILGFHWRRSLAQFSGKAQRRND